MTCKQIENLLKGFFQVLTFICAFVYVFVIGGWTAYHFFFLETWEKIYHIPTYLYISIVFFLLSSGTTVFCLFFRWMIDKDFNICKDNRKEEHEED